MNLNVSLCGKQHRGHVKVKQTQVHEGVRLNQFVFG